MKVASFLRQPAFPGAVAGILVLLAVPFEARGELPPSALVTLAAASLHGWLFRGSCSEVVVPRQLYLGFYTYVGRVYSAGKPPPPQNYLGFLKTAANPYR